MRLLFFLSLMIISKYVDLLKIYFYNIKCTCIRDVVYLTIKLWKIEIHNVVYFLTKNWYITIPMDGLSLKIHESPTFSHNWQKKAEWYTFRFEITNKDSHKIEAKLLWNLVIIQCNFIGNCCSSPCLYPIDNEEDRKILIVNHSTVHGVQVDYL